MSGSAKRLLLWTACFVAICMLNRCLGLQPALAANSPVPDSPLDWDGWLTIGLFTLVFFTLVWELLPPDVVMVLGAGVLVVTGVISPQQFLMGFSRDIIFILAMLFIVAHAMETCGILSVLARYALPKARDGWKVIAKLTVPVSFLSGFLNNTPIVLMLTPMVRGWALEGERSPSRYLMLLSFASILGGACTLIGTSTNLIINDLLKNELMIAELGFF